MPPISRELFLTSKPQTKEIELKSLGGSLTVRELGSDEVTEFSRLQKESESSAVSYLLRTGVVDAQGNPLFTAADADALSKRPFALTNPLIDAILILSGIREASLEKKSAENS